MFFFNYHLIFLYISGNPVAMEAGFQALQLLKKEGFYEELQRKANLLIQPIQSEMKSKNMNACIQQVGSMFTIFFGKQKVQNREDAKQTNGEMFARFFRHMFEQGIYIPPSQYEAWFISQAHTDDHLIKTKDLVIDFLREELV